MKLNKRDVSMFVGGGLVGAIVGGVVIIDQLVKSDTFGPVIAKALADKIVGSLDDDYAYRRKPRRVSYTSYYDAVNKRDKKFDVDIVFGSRDGAEKAKDQLLEIYETYDCVTVADLYEIAEIKPIDPKMHNYGWIDKRRIDARVVNVDGGYMIELPKPVPLN